MVTLDAVTAGAALDALPAEMGNMGNAGDQLRVADALQLHSEPLL